MKKYLIISLISIILLLFFSWILIEPYLIQKESIEIPFKNLSPEAAKLKIVQISDIHFEGFTTIPRKISEELIRLKPDYLFITGDIVNWDIEKLDELNEFLLKLSAIQGMEMFGVFGNHEYLSKKFPLVEKMLNESAIRFLHNQSVLLKEGINLVGVDDPHLNLDDFKKASEGIDLNLPTIILAHSPEILDEISLENSLILCGHTHGGQINIPFITNLLFLKKGNRTHKSGLFKENGKYLYINRGVGTTFLPVRFNAFPEITDVFLKSVD
ncbi:MAG: metallophosphoesterase [Candidatus Paceibacterota bacterium]